MKARAVEHWDFMNNVAITTLTKATQRQKERPENTILVAVQNICWLHLLGTNRVNFN